MTQDVFTADRVRESVDPGFCPEAYAAMLRAAREEADRCDPPRVVKLTADWSILLIPADRGVVATADPIKIDDKTAAKKAAQLAGIDKAKLVPGKYLGRAPTAREKALALIAQGWTRDAILAETGISRSTFFRAQARAKAAQRLALAA